MLLGFKRQFAPFVEEGSKTHTIRAPRVIRPKVGDVAHCYVDPRQKTMRLLGRWPVTRVERVLINPIKVKPDGVEIIFGLRIVISGVELSAEEANEFLWRDGFRAPGIYPAMAQARDFWRKRLERGPFTGELIHWNFALEAKR